MRLIRRKCTPFPVFALLSFWQRRTRRLALSFRLPIVTTDDKNMHTVLKPALLAAAIAAGFLATQASHAEAPAAAVTLQRTVAAFSAIELSGPYDVVVRAHGQQALTLSGERKQLDEIETFVRGDTLVVRPVERNGFHFSWGKRRAPVVIHITAQQLKSLAMSGSGDVELAQLAGERFSVSVDGPGDLQASGAVRVLAVRASGSGDLDLHRVRAADVELTMSGPGDVHLSGVGNRLAATVSGSGDLEADGLRLARLDARMSGPGGMTLSGSARELRLEASGSGDFEACSLVAGAASTVQRGPGKACVAGAIQRFDATVSGSGGLQASGLQAASAMVRLSGPGSATLGGSIGELNAEVSGSGDLEGDELHVKRATVKARGPGGIELAGVSDTLDAELHGSGGLDADMDGKRLLLKITGPGAAHLKGKVGQVKARLSGSGSLEGRELTAARADIAVTGPAHAAVNVTGQDKRRAERSNAGRGQLLLVDRSGSRRAE